MDEDDIYYPPRPVEYFPNQKEYLGYVQGFLNDCNNINASQTTWIVKIDYRYEDQRPYITRAAFKSDNYYSVEDNFLDWWDTNHCHMFDPDGEFIVELFTNYSPSEICAPRLADWLEKNKYVRRLTIYFSFVYAWDEQKRKVSKFDYVKRRLQMLKNHNDIVRILKINRGVLENWADDIGVPFLGYNEDLRYSNRVLERLVVTWPKSILSLRTPTLQLNYPNLEEFQDYVTWFLHNCNDSGAQGTIWIVRVTEFFEYENPVVKRAAFQNDGSNFVEENFKRWWDTEYKRTLDIDGGHTKVELYMNYTPTEICAPRLLNWLQRNKNVTELKIYFAFFYTWNLERRVVPKEEYVRRIEELTTSTDRTVKIGKVDKWVLQKLAKEAAVCFPGYENPSYSNERFEINIMTDPDLMDF